MIRTSDKQPNQKINPWIIKKKDHGPGNLNCHPGPLIFNGYFILMKILKSRANPFVNVTYSSSLFSQNITLNLL
jgi:hypothetical protein